MGTKSKKGLVEEVEKYTKAKTRLRKAKRKAKKEVKPNWERIIALSAAGNYISNQLTEELKKV
jgi:uncharacterized protein YeeX (DUF496 family)